MIEDTLNRIANALERIASVAEGQGSLPGVHGTPIPSAYAQVVTQSMDPAKDGEYKTEQPAEPKRTRAKKAEPARERTEAEQALDAKLAAARGEAPADPETPAEQTEAPPEPKVTPEEMRAQCRDIARKNLSDAKFNVAFGNLLEKYDVKGISKVPDDQSAAFLADIKKLAA